MKTSAKNIAAGVVICVIFGVISYRFYDDWNMITSLEWRRHPGLFALHFGLLCTCFALWTLGWRVLVQGIGQQWNLRTAAYTWLTANLGKYVPGMVLMLVGRVELCQRRGLQRASCVGALMLEHALLLVAAAPFMVGAALLGVRVGSFTTATTVCGAIIGAFIVVHRTHWLKMLLNIGLKLLRRDPAEFTVSTRMPARLLLFYMASWLAYGLSGWALSIALGMGDQIPVSALVCAFVAAWMIGFLSVLTPGGLGVREVALAALLGPFMPATQSMVLAVVARLTWTVVEMLGVVLGIRLGKNLPPLIGGRARTE